MRVLSFDKQCCLQVGMVQNILSKAIKYALFDPTKEMAYIPLDQDTKVCVIRTY